MNWVHESVVRNRYCVETMGVHVSGIEDIVDGIHDQEIVADIEDTADGGNDQENLGDIEDTTDGSNDQENLADNEDTTNGSNDQENLADIEDTTDGRNEKETATDNEDTTDGRNENETVADTEDTTDDSNNQETVACIEDTTDGRNEKETVADTEDTTDGSNNQETVAGIEDTTDGSNDQEALADIEDTPDGSSDRETLAGIEDVCEYRMKKRLIYGKKTREALVKELLSLYKPDYRMKKRLIYEKKAREALVKAFLSLDKPDSFDTPIKFKELIDRKLQLLQYQPEINHKYTIHKQDYVDTSGKFIEEIKEKQLSHIEISNAIHKHDLDLFTFPKIPAATRIDDRNRVLAFPGIGPAPTYLTQSLVEDHEKYLMSKSIFDSHLREYQSNLTDENINPPKKGRPSLILNVINSSVFRNAMDGIRHGMYESAYVRFFLNNCRRFIDIPINRFDFLGRSEKKGM